MKKMPSLKTAIVLVRAQRPNEAVRSEGIRAIAAFPSIAQTIDRIVGVLGKGADPYTPCCGEVREMCHAKIVELIHEARMTPIFRELEAAVIRSLPSRVVAEYDRRWEDSPPLPTAARRHVKNRRLAEDANVEPTEMAWSELLKKPVEEIRTARFAYNLSCLRSFNGDWLIPGPDGFAVPARPGHQDEERSSNDGDDQVLDSETVCDLHDRYGG